MTFKKHLAVLLGLLTLLKNPPPRDERGLSQSADTAIIVGGAVTIAIVVVALIRAFVTTELGKL